MIIDSNFGNLCMKKGGPPLRAYATARYKNVFFVELTTNSNITALVHFLHRSLSKVQLLIDHWTLRFHVNPIISLKKLKMRNIAVDRLYHAYTKLWEISSGVYFDCIFTLLSRESDQCAIRACLEVAGHLSTTPRWGNPARCLSQRHNK